jgi:hypothetical protein
LTGSGKKKEQQLQNTTQTYIQQAAQPTEMQTALDKHNKAVIEGLDSGKDVKDISELSPYYNLYNNSINDNQDYAGEGLLSANELSGGNSGQLGLIGKQLNARRKQQAQGDLYNAVQGARNDATTGGMWSANLTNQRNLGVAGLEDNLYNQYLNRPNRPGLFSQIMQGVTAIGGTGAMMAGI